jgi:hypothetical protein
MIETIDLTTPSQRTIDLCTPTTTTVDLCTPEIIPTEDEEESPILLDPQ